MNKTLFSEISELMLEYHYYGKQNNNGISSQPMARRDPPFGRHLFEIITKLDKDQPDQMHLRFKGLYDILITIILVHDQRDIMRQKADGYMVGDCGIRYLQSIMSAKDDNTRHWLSRQRVTSESMLPRAIVELASNAPALVQCFPETFANDMQDFLIFHNTMETLVNMVIQAPKYDSQRMKTMECLMAHMEKLKVSEFSECFPDAAPAEPAQQLCYSTFMHRFCRVARVNLRVHMERYRELIPQLAG